MYDQIHWWVERWEWVDHRIDRVIEADSLIDLLIEEIDFELVIVAGSLWVSFKQTNYWVTDSMTRSISNASL